MKIQKLTPEGRESAKQRVPTDKCKGRALELAQKLSRIPKLTDKALAIALALDAEYWNGAADTRREDTHNLIDSGYESGENPQA